MTSEMTDEMTPENDLFDTREAGEFDLPTARLFDPETLATFFERAAAALRGEADTDATLAPATVLTQFQKDHTLEYDGEENERARWTKGSNTHTLTLVLKEYHERRYPNGEEWMTRSESTTGEETDET